MVQQIQNLQQIWQRTSLIQRVLLVVILLVCIGAVALLVGWATQPQMSLLYSGLAPEEAGKILEKINDADVPYELADGGSTIKVPVEQVHSLRLTMASQGLPVGGQAGYQILDREKIGTSPFTQRVNYTRAIEGELAKTIKLVDGVTTARVHIVRPETALFAGQRKNASATVLVRVRPGWRLSPSNVAAITSLVAGSVENLVPEKVVVVDGRGRLLTGGGEGSELARKANTLLDYKTQVEEYLAEKAEKMLAAVLGPNRASVRVDAEIDITGSTESIEKYDADNKVITKEELRSSSTTPASGADGAGKGATTKEEDTITEYLVSRTVSQTTNLPGKIKSLMVAAMVDLSAPAASEESEGTAAPTVISIKDVEDIIRNAVGLKQADALKVVQTTFHQPAGTEDSAEEDDGLISPGFLLEMARRFSLGILVIGVLVAMRVLRGPKKKAGGSGGAQPALEGQVGGMSNLLPEGLSENDAALMRAQITQTLRDNPEQVKRLFSSWVSSEEGET